MDKNENYAKLLKLIDKSKEKEEELFSIIKKDLNKLFM